MLSLRAPLIAMIRATLLMAAACCLGEDQGAAWWDSRWPYRVPITVVPSAADRQDFVVVARLRLIEQHMELTEVAIAETDTIQIVEEGHKGGPAKPIPRAVEVEDGYDALSPKAKGLVAVRWVVSGKTAPGEARRYHIYWRTVDAQPDGSQPVTRQDLARFALRSPPEGTSPNLVRNGDFEQSEGKPSRDGRTWPGWDAAGDSPVTQGRPDGAGGALCARFLAPGTGQTGLMSKMAPVCGGEVYLWSLRLLMTKAEHDGVHVELFWYGADRRRVRITPLLRWHHGSPEWVRRDGRIEAPVNSRFVSVYVRSFVHNSAVYVDDVVLRREDTVELGRPERFLDPKLLKTFGAMSVRLSRPRDRVPWGRAQPFPIELKMLKHVFTESPGEIDAYVRLNVPQTDLLLLAAQLEPHSGPALARAVLALREALPTRRLDVRIPKLPLGSYRLRGELLRANGQRLASFCEFFRIAEPPRPAGRIALTLREPAGVARERGVATVGVPFPAGALRDHTRVRLLDERGREVPSQWNRLATWQDGSAKWLFLTFSATLGANEQQRFFVEYGGERTRSSGIGVQVRDATAGVTIDTGKLRFTVRRKPFALLSDVSVDQGGAMEALPLDDRRQAFIQHESGKVLDAAAEAEITILERGPVRAAVQIKGWHTAEDGQRFCLYDLRLYAYVHQSHLRLLHTFTFTGDPEQDRVHSMGVRLRPTLSGRAQVRFCAAAGAEPLAASANVILLQDDWQHFSLRADGLEIREGGHATGWIDLCDRHVGVQLGVRDFWQQYPKALAVESGAVTAYLWPPSQLMDLKWNAEGQEYPKDNARGVAKTHEVLIQFHTPQTYGELARQFRRFEEPLVATPPTEWACATRVFGPMGHRDPQHYPQIEDALSEMFDWDERIVGWPKQHSYGFWNFIDLHYSWEIRWKRKRYWFNNEYGAAQGPWLMYLRSGDRKYLRFAERHTRHIMDVDTIHYRPQDPGKVGGQHVHNFKQHWAAVPNMGHTFLEYALYHYYVTGDVRGLDVAREHGQYVLDWWARTKPNVRRPIERMDRFWHNPIRALVPIYEATWDERYRAAYEEIVETVLSSDMLRHCSHVGHYTAKAHSRYCEATHDARLKNVFVQIAERYHRRFGVPATSIYAYELLSYAYELTGDERFLQRGADALRVAISTVNRDPHDLYRRGEGGGWWSSSLYFQQVPFLIGAMQRAGLALDQLRMPRHIFHMRSTKPEFVMLEETDRDWELVLSKYGGRGDGVATVSLLNPSGKTVDRREVNRAIASNVYVFRVPRDGVSGVYRLEIDEGVGANGKPMSCSLWQIARGPKKTMARLSPDGAIRAMGSHEWGWRYYFWVPPRTKELTARLRLLVRGMYGGRVFDPSGAVRGEVWVGRLPSRERGAIHQSHRRQGPAGRCVEHQHQGLSRGAA